MANTSSIAPNKGTAEYTLSRPSGAQGSKGRSRLSATTPSGRRTACRCCFRPNLRGLDIPTGSTWHNLTVVPPAKFSPTSSHKTNCERVQPSGIPTERESLSGPEIFRQVPSFGRCPLLRGPVSSWKLLLRSSGSLQRLPEKVKLASSEGSTLSPGHLQAMRFTSSEA